MSAVASLKHMANSEYQHSQHENNTSSSTTSTTPQPDVIDLNAVHPDPMNTTAESSVDHMNVNTSSDSTDDDPQADAQLLSASILATIQTTPRNHKTPPSSLHSTSSHTSSSHHQTTNHTSSSHHNTPNHTSSSHHHTPNHTSSSHHNTPNHKHTPNGRSYPVTPSEHHANHHSSHHSSHHDSYDASESSFDTSRDYDKRHENGETRRNGKNTSTTNNNMYPPSPTANQTPRRRSARVVKPAKSYPSRETDREKSSEKGDKERVKERANGEKVGSKRESKSSGSGAKRARKRQAVTNDSTDNPPLVPVLGRQVELESLRGNELSGDGDTVVDFNDPNWAASVSMYSLVRAWLSAGVDIDPFHILRPDSAESVLLDIAEYIPPPTLPPPSPTIPNSLPERPKTPTNPANFQVAIQKGSESAPTKEELLKSYVSNCKTFRSWWKTNYTQRLNRYKSRLAILFPDPAQQQPAAT